MAKKFTKQPEPVKLDPVRTPQEPAPAVQIVTAVKRNILGHVIVHDPAKAGIGHGDDNRRAK